MRVIAAVWVVAQWLGTLVAVLLLCGFGLVCLAAIYAIGVETYRRYRVWVLRRRLRRYLAER